MPNKLYNNPHDGKGPGGRRTHGTDGKPASSSISVKPGFPGTSLPGKGGPSRDRGTKRSGHGGPFYVDAKGLG